MLNGKIAAAGLLSGGLASLAVAAPSTSSSSAQQINVSPAVVERGETGTLDARFNTWYESEPGTLDGTPRGGIIILR